MHVLMRTERTHIHENIQIHLDKGRACGFVDVFGFIQSPPSMAKRNRPRMLAL